MPDRMDSSYDVYPIIDIHAHVFPPKILDRAVASISRFYDLQVHLDGSLTTLISENQKAGIACSVVFSTATVMKQVASIHEFIREMQDTSGGHLVGFGPDHVLFGTDYPIWSASEELARFAKLSLTKNERKQILYTNAAKLLSISSFSSFT